jgi:hypothetical protein
MPARRAIALTAALLLIPAASAADGSHSAIKGRVIDRTCYGPCVVPRVGKPFDGPGDVVVRRLPSRSVAARTTVVDSGFRVRVGAGKYLVKVIPYPASPDAPCWRGSKKKVVLDAGEVARPMLAVSNQCVR